MQTLFLAMLKAPNILGIVFHVHQKNLEYFRLNNVPSPLQDVLVLILRICEYLPIQGKRDFMGVTKLRV